MSLYYQDDFVTIFHGDCREVTDWMMTDVIVSDPPYGIGEATNRKQKKRSALASANDFDPVYGDDEPFDPTLLISLNKPMALFGANYFCDKLPISSKWLVWDKLDGLKTDKRDVGFNDNADVELIWTNLKGPARIFSHRWMGILKASEGTSRRCHPTQKPIALMSWIINQMPSGIIADPYMGSGSTLRAAKDLGRKVIGVEINEAYCEVAAKRCSQEVLFGVNDYETC